MQLQYLTILLTMNKDFKKGTFAGLLAPIVAYVVYVAFYLEANVEQTFHAIVKMNKLSHVISLSVLINLLLFFMNLKTKRDDMAKGILFATLIYAFIVLGLKLF